jgi:hypothetical protein
MMLANLSRKRAQNEQIMVKIKIILFGRSVPFHFPRHIAAVISDQESQRSFTIDYPFPKTGQETIDPQTAQDSLYGRAKTNCCISVTTLYSDQNYLEFIKQFGEHFAKANQYTFLSHNCASAVDFALDYFFPDDSDYQALNTIYRALFSASCLITCGLIACFPAPPCIDTPTDVYNKAKLYATRHGKCNLAQRSDSKNTTTVKLFDPSPAVSFKMIKADPVEKLCIDYKLIK